MKFYKLKWLFVALTFFISGGSSATDYSYLALSDGGYYEDAKAGFLNFLDNTKDDQSQIGNVSVNLSLFLRDAARLGDYETVYWLQEQIKTHKIRLKKFESSDSEIDGLRLAILSDISVLNDPSFTQKSRQEVINSHENLEYGYLWDAEFIFVCNQIIDFYSGFGNFKDAKTRVNSCLGEIARRNNYSVDEALDFLARVAKIRVATGTQSGDNRVLLALGAALSSPRLNLFSPTAIDAMANLALAEAARGNPFVKIIHDQALMLKEEGVYLPELLALKFQYAFDILDATYGLDGEVRLETDYSKPAIEMFSKLNELKRFNLNQPTNDFIQYSDPIDSMGVVHELYEFVNTPPVIENREHLEKQLREFVDKTWGLYHPIHSFESFENRDSSFELFALRTLLKYFSSINDKVISETVANFLFSAVFRPKTQADYFAKVASNSILASSELHKVAQSQLKLAKDLNYISIGLMEKIVDKSVAFHERNFKYKAPDKAGKGAGTGYDFLRDRRYLQKASQQLDNISNGQLSASFNSTLLDVKKIQLALSANQILIAYKRLPSDKFENFVFKCKITTTSFNCFIETVSQELPQQILNLRNQIVDAKGKTFDLSLSSKIFVSLFPIVDFSKYDEILLFPDERDIGLPFSALVTPEAKFLGKDYNLSLLTSLTPGYRSKEITPSQKAYLALGDPAYQELVVADLKRNDVFKLRSSSQAQELSHLSLLPETRREIQKVSDLIPNSEKRILLGPDATEINFRLSAPGQYKIVHFATHGLTEGDFETIREPALALSPNQNIESTLDDSLLTETEILELDFEDTSIILSACQTAGNFGGGTSSGFKGLANAFLLAGAETVIATQWKIESSSAAQIVSDTVQFILTNPDQSSDALSNSVQKYYRHNSQNPYYWAPYVKFKSLKLENPQQRIISSDQEIFPLDFQSGGYFEPYGLKKFKEVTYANGTYTQYTKGTNVEFSKSILINIENQSKFWLPEGVSAYSFLENGPNGFRMLGSVNDGLNRNPAILEISPTNETVKVVYQLPVKDVLASEYSKFTLEMGAVKAFEEHNDGSLSLVVEQMMNPDSPQNDEYIETDDFILAKYWYIKLTENFELIKLEKLPFTKYAEIFFFNERLYLAKTEFKSVGKRLRKQNTWGLYNCDSTSVILYEYSFRDNDISILQNFPGVMNVSNLADGRVFVNQYCDRNTYTSVYDLTKHKLSKNLPVIMGGLSGGALALENHGHIHFGSVTLPVSFLKLKSKRDDDGNLNYDKVEWLNKRNYILAPGNQYLQYLIYEDREGNIFNIDLKFARTLSFYADGIVDGQFLYLLESEERENNRVVKVDINDFLKAISRGDFQ